MTPVVWWQRCVCVLPIIGEFVIVGGDDFDILNAVAESLEEEIDDPKYNL